jgi:hypothetical protein
MKRALLTLALVAGWLLAACAPGTVSVRVGIGGVGPDGKVFETFWVAPEVVGVGERVSFRFRLLEQGYVNIWIVDSDGHVAPLVHDLFIRRYRPIILRGTEAGFFVATPPLGYHEAWALFSESPIRDALLFRPNVEPREAWLALEAWRAAVPSGYTDLVSAAFIVGD